MRINIQFFGGNGASSPQSGSFKNSLVKKTVYHGTNVENIKNFNTNGKESNGAIFFSDDADYAEEEAYIKGEKGGKETLYEVKINVKIH